MKLDCIEFARPRAYPPRVSAFTRPFWDGLAEGLWRTTGCTACGKLTFPPKAVCPHCWSDAMTWRALPAGGTLYSWTRIHAAPSAFVAETPYAVCIVDLDGGLRIAARLIERDGTPPRVGDRVDMISLLYQDGPLFGARPVA